MKKIVCLLLTLILCSACLVACNKNNPNSEESKTVAVNHSFNANDGDEVDGVKTFKTVQSAINYFGQAGLSANANKIIKISAGSYNEKITVPKELQNVKLIGDPQTETKITFGDYAAMLDESGNIIGTDNTATANIHGDGFSASNIYFENSFDYFRKDITSDKQALAIYVKADKVIFNKCKFTGYQDTLECVSGRQYYYQCEVAGCVDFIFGNNPAALFEDCDIVHKNRNEKNGGYITAMKGNNGTNGEGVADYGVVFKNCRLTAETGVLDGSVALGRPWRADATVSFINCEMGAHIGKNAVGYGSGRYAIMDGGGLTNYPKNARFFEFNNTGAGSTSDVLYCRYFDYTLKKYVEETERPDFTHLTETQANNYTIANIFAKTNGMITYESEWDASSDLNALSEL